MSFTAKILFGLFLGILTGLFFGEDAAAFSIGGDIFIGLLQMTVLPYIVVSLVANLGRISWSERRGLLVASIGVLAALLLLGAATLLVTPLALPEWKTASFFSSSLVELPKAFDFVALYVPTNPFASLSNNVVPAVVLFSILLGIGISGVPGNQGLIRGLDVLATGLNAINKMVIKTTPVGVFAIAAGTAGTISVAELSRLQAYVLTYTVIATVLSFAVLPLIVTAFTPFRYRDLLAIPRDTLITIFAAAKIIVVLPQLIENVKELFRRYELEDEDVQAGADVLMPLAYPFPNLGTYAILMFVPFGAWYIGRSFDLVEVLGFQGACLLSSFVAPITGIPFLLDLMHVPSDLMELFVISTVYTDRIRVVLGAMHLLTLTILTLAITRGVFRVDPRRLLRVAAISLVLMAASLLGVRVTLSRLLEGGAATNEALERMHLLDASAVKHVYEGSLPPAAPEAAQQGRLETVRERGTLRVGYLPDSLPFAFRNSEAQIVGFDVEMAHYLARDLGVGLVLVLVQARGGAISDLFETGQLDIVMSGLAITPGRAMEWNFTRSPMDLTLAFLVPDSLRGDYSNLEKLRRGARGKWGVVQSDPAFSALIKRSFPDATTEVIRSPRAFLRDRRPDLEAVVYSAEGGAAWTLLYPGYSVAVPIPLIVEVPASYPVPKNDDEWTRFVSAWVTLKQKDGTVDALFDHWILGAGANDEKPRWSIARDVLGWRE